jgi:hypothetical protein
VLGLVLGILLSAIFLPVLGNTLAFGHHGGEGDKSVAAFNRRYGSVLALGVGVTGLFCFIQILSFRS